MKFKGIIIISCMLYLLGGCGKPGELSHYEEGAKALEEAKYEKAVESFELSIADDKKVTESLRGEGISFLRQGKFSDAVTVFQTALDKVNKKDQAMKKDVMYYLAVSQYRGGNLPDTVKTCNEILDMGADKDAYFLRGTVYLEQDAYEDAASDFDKVVLKSNDYNDFLNIYRVYQRNDMSADGDAYLEKALDIKSAKEEDALNRGRVYYYLQDYDKAKSELIQSMNDGSQEAALFLAKVYVAVDDVSNARAMYQRYLDDQGKSAKGYNGLAYCDIAEGDYDSALDNIQKGLDLEEEEEKQGLLYNEIVAYEKKLDFATAKAKSAEYLARYPDDEAAAKENEFIQTR